MKKITVLAFVCLGLFSLNLYAERIGSSDEKWKTIKTEHFDVVFSAKQQDLSLYYAQVAERAYQNLSTVFTTLPDRTVVVVNDSTDLSNGYATRIPYQLIMAYPVQVSEHDSLSEAGEWARELITHEMTHIAQLEPATGFYNFLRPIFGTIVAPNLLLPLWWKEGMAVEMETQFSPGGRTRSHFQDATLRAFHLEHKLFSYTLAEANEALPSWPYGSRSYVFGSVFWSQVLKDYKINAANYIVQRHGERVPYFVEQPMIDLTNSSYEINYLKALHEVDENSRVQVEQLEKLTPTAFSFLQNEGQASAQPAYSKAHNLLAYLDFVDGKNSIRLQSADGVVIKDLKRRPTDQISDLVFHPTERQIIYAKSDDDSPNQFYSDLYIYDLNTDKSEKIVSTDRARSPSFSADGKFLIFVTTDDGKSQIKILEMATKALQPVKSFPYQERVYSPLFWDAENILYTKRLADKTQILIRYNLNTKTETQLLSNVPEIRFLRKAGSKLYFTSTENGVQNIYVTSDFKTIQPLTHTLTGIWSFDVAPDQNRLWATIMTGDGFKVAESKIEPIKAKLPKIENKIADRYTYTDKTKDVQLPEPEDYAAAGYLWPRYWIPYVATASSSKGVYLQAQTSGQDPLQIYKYALSVNYQTDIQKGGFNGSYTNSAFALPFQLGATQVNQSFGTTDAVVETKTNYLSLLPNMFPIEKDMVLAIGAQTTETNYLGTQTKHWGPYTSFAYSNYSQNIFQISPEKGWGVFLRYENNKSVQSISPDTGDYNKVYGTLIGFHSKWLPKHHAIMSRINGLLIGENVRARYGSTNSSAFMAQDFLLPEFVLRGYPSSQFYGRSIWTWNTEYRFPITRLERGSGTDPYFLKEISGAIVADGLGVKGNAITENKVTDTRDINESFWSAGAELKLSTTIGYVLPMNFILGYYMPFSGRYASSSQMAFNLQIGGL